MKAQWHFLREFALCVALAAVASPATAQPIALVAPAPSSENVLRELNQLLIADSLKGVATKPAGATARELAPSAPGAVVMSPYVVKEPRFPKVGESKFEPPLMRFLRDGTLHENFGRRFTTRVKLRFYSTDATPDDPAPAMFGNVKPRNGAQLGLSWSW
jgi:hypothetical protein